MSHLTFVELTEYLKYELLVLPVLGILLSVYCTMTLRIAL